MNYITSKNDVINFLTTLHRILEDKDFNVEDNLYLIVSHKNKGTLTDLEFDVYDVVDRLKELTVNEYSHTLLDQGDNNPPLLFVFGKNINDRCVYIKIKIKGEYENKVLCLSFHYAEWDMNFPYA